MRFLVQEYFQPGGSGAIYIEPDTQFPNLITDIVGHYQ